MRQAHAQPGSPTPEQALQRLVGGNARYVAAPGGNAADREARVLGQAPFAAVLGCADSRITPELAFDQGAGDLFVVRVAGNFVTADGLASLEYGAAVLGTKVIMVLGHSQCGAITAAVKAVKDGNRYPGHIADLVRAIKPGIFSATRQAGDDLVQRATVANVKYTVNRLQNATPILADLVRQGRLRIAGGVYDLATGRVDMV